MGENQKLMSLFDQFYPTSTKKDKRLFFAPGRVNLIGEHTDYNGGYVFPAALTIGTYMVVREREDEVFHLASLNFDQKITFSLHELVFKEEDDWGNYPKGIIKELVKEGVSLKGADILYEGTIPNGAGLSSSASIGMVTAYALSKLANAKLSRVDLAKLCQRMENHFIGVNSGIMDQYAVGLCKEKHAIYLNTMTMHAEDVPLELHGHKIVITNTNKRRGLADSKYNERRAQCEEALKRIQREKTSIQTLSDLSVADLPSIERLIDDELLYRRAKHVVTENKRTSDAKKALQAGDLLLFGQLMIGSHLSLKEDYEVTGKELDALFEAQRRVEGCVGTRMTGAGFGGCTVSVVKEEAVELFKESVEVEYEQETGLTPTFYICEAGNGVHEVQGEV
ncbi:galactokinase [Halalkalibacter akibai]|uniref:Galactokinase n=1 Tax=Halalkalibacter akibai (strain ATCC 43226 / DSM 21942 / CIP 109018 / JCM 9157 / 1139) TaxID=1236973 RepID=W4QTK0_HALA3|nr:galactokinase [Halalkalibacter akibai]GAE35252.1 galactokinase [Halalkalibacter akibai JCM 9157]